MQIKGIATVSTGITSIPSDPVTSADTTLMFQEAAEASDAAARFLSANQATLERIAVRLRSHPPSVVVTCARGSSDHAATYAKYLIETITGVVTASAAPSVASIYPSPGKFGANAPNCLCLAISQSGKSPDLLASVEVQQKAGAFVIALVNEEASPLAKMADETLFLKAGPERSVAATKSYITSLIGIVALVAYWVDDVMLKLAVDALPQQLRAAFEQDWTPAIAPLHNAQNLFVIGRGYGLGIAQEAALKLKETCGLHAECFSSAEVRHGPMAIVGRGFPVLCLAGSDKAGDDVRDVAAIFAERGAAVCLADALGTGNLPAARTHPVIEPILIIQSFYRMANALSIARGFNPDTPPFLNKVTRTI